MAGLRNSFLEVKVGAFGVATSAPAGGGSINDSILAALTAGTGTSQANRAAYQTGTISAAGSADIDLNGSIEDINGDTLALDKMVAFVLVNTSTNGAYLTLTDKSAGGLTVGATGFIATTQHKINIPAGGFVAWHSPAGVATAAGSDAITLAAPGAAATYKLYVIGIDS